LTVNKTVNNRQMSFKICVKLGVLLLTVKEKAVFGKFYKCVKVLYGVISSKYLFS